MIKLGALEKLKAELFAPPGATGTTGAVPGVLFTPELLKYSEDIVTMAGFLTGRRTMTMRRLLNTYVQLQIVIIKNDQINQNPFK